MAEEISSIGEISTPTQILEKASDPSTELHKCFEWDDQKAAYRWRLHQARQIVCHLVIKELESQAPVQIRVFHKTDAGDGYKSVELIMRDKSAYAELLERARAELRAFKEKYHSLSELSEIFELID